MKEEEWTREGGRGRKGRKRKRNPEKKVENNTIVSYCVANALDFPV